MERTLVLVKPDGVQRGLIGEIVGRFEAKGLKVVGLRFLSVSRDLAERHYEVHSEKPFFSDLVEFITSGPVAAVALEGEEAISVVRALVGGTRPAQAQPGTIRGDLGLTTLRNLIHASDGPETAAAELRLWFGAEPLVDYPRDLDRWIGESQTNPSSAAQGSQASPSSAA